MQFGMTSQWGQLSGVKGMVYSRSGMGKTMLASTAPAAIVVATEPGLLSLAGFNLPYILCQNLKELRDAAAWLESSNESRQFATAYVDSITETMETILAEELPKAGKEPRKAYNALQFDGLEIMKRFRDLPGKNVILTAKEVRDKDETTGGMIYQPNFPGKALGYNAPYLFDFVFHIEIANVNGVNQRVLRTQPNAQYEAKDRSGRLFEIEPANLGYVFAKIMGAQQ